ncbi:MAG: hypothetical protein AAF356_05960 [Planctomycetota bacterium]
MAKFKMRMKLEGFELDIEGEREAIPTIAQNIGEQFSGLLAPAANIVEGEPPKKLVANDAQAAQAAEPKPAKRKKRSSGGGRAGAAASAADESNVLNWQHNPEKWGNPLQSWTTAEKSIWLLYVIEKELNRTAVPAKQIVGTFNHHFKQAKTVHPPNVTRDLGGLRSGANSEVGEDSTKSPSEWFLTNAGKTRAERLVAAALGKPEAASS